MALTESPNKFDQKISDQEMLKQLRTSIEGTVTSIEIESNPEGKIKYTEKLNSKFEELDSKVKDAFISSISGGVTEIMNEDEKKSVFQNNNQAYSGF